MTAALADIEAVAAVVVAAAVAAAAVVADILVVAAAAVEAIALAHGFAVRKLEDMMSVDLIEQLAWALAMASARIGVIQCYDRDIARTWRDAGVADMRHSVEAPW